MSSERDQQLMVIARGILWHEASAAERSRCLREAEQVRERLRRAVDEAGR